MGYSFLCYGYESGISAWYCVSVSSDQRKSPIKGLLVSVADPHPVGSEFFCRVFLDGWIQIRFFKNPQMHELCAHPSCSDFLPFTQNIFKHKQLIPENSLTFKTFCYRCPHEKIKKFSHFS